jgi:hypothetical protein
VQRYKNFCKTSSYSCVNLIDFIPTNLS